MTNASPASSLPVRLALVTGGSRGLGRAMVLHLADQGIDSIFTYRAQAKEAAALVAEVEARGRRAVALALDVVDDASYDAFIDAVRAAVASFGAGRTLDALVNNAGVGAYAPFAETTAAQLDNMFQVHFKSVFLLSQKLLPVLRDGGRIINVSSGLARFSNPGYSAYGPMKAAVDALTRYMALELGARHITVNVLAPGAIETDFGGGVVRDNPQVNAMIAGQTALGRVGVPDDVGGALALLLAPGAGWINGQRIEVAGGTHL